MKVAIVSPGTHSVPVVLGTSVEHDIQMVTQELQKIHEVTVYTRICKEHPVSSREWNLRYVRFRFQSFNHYLQQVILHMKRWKPDIIMVENRPVYVLKIRDSFPDTPVVLNMHSAKYASPPQISFERMQEVSRCIDALITNSQYLRNYYVDRFQGLDQKSYAVYLGIDCSPFEEAIRSDEKVSRLRSNYGIKKDHPTLLFVGRLIREKGIHLVLDVLPQMIRKYPNLKLIVTGSSRYGKNITTPYVRLLRKKSANIENHIVFTKFITPANIPYLYQLADVVVVPSIWHEPFGRVNLEAMASGKPVVAAKRGGIPEVIRHNGNGLLFSIKNYKKELSESLTRLLDSPKLRKEYGNKGLQLVRSFTWSRTAGEYARIFHTCLIKRRRR